MVDGPCIDWAMRCVDFDDDDDGDDDDDDVFCGAFSVWWLL